jgi:hypothetical protein
MMRVATGGYDTTRSHGISIEEANQIGKENVRIRNKEHKREQKLSYNRIPLLGLSSGEVGLCGIG